MYQRELFHVEGRNFLVTIEEINKFRYNECAEMDSGFRNDIRDAIEVMLENEGTVPDTPDFYS